MQPDDTRHLQLGSVSLLVSFRPPCVENLLTLLSGTLVSFDTGHYPTYLYSSWPLPPSGCWSTLLWMH